MSMRGLQGGGERSHGGDLEGGLTREMWAVKLFGGSNLLEA